MHIIKEPDKIRIIPGKPTRISIKGNHVKVGEVPREFKPAAFSLDRLRANKAYGVDTISG